MISTQTLEPSGEEYRASIAALRAALDRVEADKAKLRAAFELANAMSQAQLAANNKLIPQIAALRAHQDATCCMLDQAQSEFRALRAELAAVRSVLIRVDEWWTSLSPGLRQDIEGSGAVPGCIAAVLTALQSHQREDK